MATANGYTTIRRAVPSSISYSNSRASWQPTKISNQIAAMDLDADIGFCHTDVTFIDGEGRPIAEKPRTAKSGIVSPERIVVHSFIDQPQKNYHSSGILTSSSVLIRRSALAASSLLDPDLPICGDTDLWLKISLHYKLAFVPSPETVYRLHDCNLSKDSSGMTELKQLRDRYQGYAKRTGNSQPALAIANLVAEAPAHFAAQQIDLCRKSLHAGNLPSFIRHFITAIRFDFVFVWRSCFHWLRMRVRSSPVHAEQTRSKQSSNLKTASVSGLHTPKP